MPAAHPHRHWRAAAILGFGLALAGCAGVPPLPDAQVLIYGEQHDQPDHQRQVAADIARLAYGAGLGAVVIEMAERGHSTAGLPRNADAQQVRDALAWSSWEWSAYEPVVMAAVHAGVPVLGGNLARGRLRDAMADPSRDGDVDAPAREKIAVAVRDGHCGALPQAQVQGMVRIQIARDRSMAETVAQALAASDGGRVLLLTGAQHAARDQGVPLHLAAATRVHVTIFGDASSGLGSDAYRPALVTPRPDPCIGLRERFAKPATPP